MWGAYRDLLKPQTCQSCKCGQMGFYTNLNRGVVILFCLGLFIRMRSTSQSVHKGRVWILSKSTVNALLRLMCAFCWLDWITALHTAASKMIVNSLLFQQQLNITTSTEKGFVMWLFYKTTLVKLPAECRCRGWTVTSAVPSPLLIRSFWPAYSVVRESASSTNHCRW